MRRILHETGADRYQAYISGSENYRYAIDPTYKANRVDVVRPLWLQPVREHLVLNWNAQVCDGIEADDMLGIEQTQAGEETIIASIDKDLKQIPGRHYNFVLNEFDHVSPRQALLNFYTQLIMGDKSDNILGYDGKMRQKIPQFLYPIMEQLHQCESESTMFETVREIYELGDNALLRNGQLLYIQRCEGDSWQFPVAVENP
jgi:hypothetical protein